MDMIRSTFRSASGETRVAIRFGKWGGKGRHWFGMMLHSESRVVSENERIEILFGEWEPRVLVAFRRWGEELRYSARYDLAREYLCGEWEGEGRDFVRQKDRRG